MALSDGSHVSIDGEEFKLAIDEPQHYNHRYISLFSPATAIAGEVAKDNIRQEKIVWSITDWSKGEGAVVYFPQNPAQYDVASLMNVTKRGQLTTRPQRYRDLTARAGSNADTAKRPAGSSAYTHAIIGWEDNILAASDGVTFTAAQDATPDMSTANFSDAVSDGTNVAFLERENVTSNIPVVSADASPTTWADTESGSHGGPGVGCVVDGVPYTMQDSTTLQIFKKASVMDTSSSWEATTIYNTGIDPVGTWGTNFWTSATAAETSSYWSYSTKTHGFVWEVRADVGRPFWTAPVGFVIKKLIYHMGVLFAVGNQQASGSSFATIWAIPISTRTPLIVSQPRQHQNTSLDTFSVGCAGNGPHLFVADEDTGKIFLYDIERDATMLFDDLVNGGTGDGMDFVADTDKIAFLAMHGARLFGATWTPGEANTSLQTFGYDDLEVQNRDDSQSISATLETAEWDFGLPMETKSFNRVIVNFKVTDTGTTSGLVANSRIRIDYSADDASYTQIGSTITSATTPSGTKGRVVLAAPTGTSTVLFTRLKIKITLDNNSSAVAPPILYSVQVEAEPAAYEEVWDLALRVDDEETSNERPINRNKRGHQLRTLLNTIKTNKDTVTFLDGFTDPYNNTTSSHTVRIDDLDHDVRADGTGVTRVRIRAIQS